MQPDIIVTLISWIEQNITRPIRIDDVARKAGYSKWYLQRVFRDQMHQSLASYIRHRKLTLAADELVQTNHTVMSISIRYGFDNQQAFTKVFSRVYRMPPLEWRKHTGPER